VFRTRCLPTRARYVSIVFSSLPYSSSIGQRHCRRSNHCGDLIAADGDDGIITSLSVKGTTITAIPRLTISELGATIFSASLMFPAFGDFDGYNDTYII
jgi:hypothetical protein